MFTVSTVGFGSSGRGSAELQSVGRGWPLGPAEPLFRVRPTAPETNGRRLSSRFGVNYGDPGRDQKTKIKVPEMKLAVLASASSLTNRPGAQRNAGVSRRHSFDNFLNSVNVKEITFYAARTVL